MKKLLTFIFLFVSVITRAQLMQSQGASTGTYPLIGKWVLINNLADGDSSNNLITSGYGARNFKGGGAPGGSDGDLQRRNGSSLTGSLLNQTALKITYLSDSFFVVKSANNPNQNIGYVITDNTSNIISGVQVNPQTGLISIGGFKPGYVPQLLSGGTAIVQINSDGVDIGPSPGHDGERLYVNGQTKLMGLTAIGTSPTGNAILTLSASTSSQVPIFFTGSTVDITSGLVDGMAWYNSTTHAFNFRDNSITSNLLNGIRNYNHTIFTPVTSGTVNLVNNQYNIINPAGALLALTVNLPSSPANNDVVYIKFTQAISTVTYANGTVVDGITAPTAGGLTVLTFDNGATKWY